MTEDYITAEAQELIDRAEAMIPDLLERANNTDKDGIVPEESVRAIHDAGLFRVLQPKRWGGHEMDPRVFYQIQMTLARGCMSTAWIFGVIGVHYWQLSLFPETGHRRLPGSNISKPDTDRLADACNFGNLCIGGG